MSLPDPAIRQQLQAQIRQMADHLLARAADPALLSPAQHGDIVLTLLERCRKLEDFESYVRLLNFFGTSLYFASHLAELDTHLAHALAQDALDRSQRVELAVLRALLLLRNGELAQAHGVLEEVEGAADTPRLRALLLNRRGVLYHFAEAFDKSFQAYQEALHLARQAEDQPLVATVLNNLGDWSYLRDRHEEALAYYQQALAVAHELDDPEFISSAEGGIAVTLGDLGRHDEALVHHQRARQHYAKIGDRKGIVRTEINLALLAIQRGEPGTGKAHAGEALRLAQQVADLQREAHARHLLGEGCLLAGEYAAALEHLARALEQRCATGLPRYVKTTRTMLHRLQRAITDAPTLPDPERAALLARIAAVLAAYPGR